MHSNATTTVRQRTARLHGLVHECISRRDRPVAYAHVLPGGLSVKVDNPARYRPSHAACRGKCSGQSPASGRRLKRRLMGLDFAQPASFVTLTYHEMWGTPEEWKRHLEVFVKRLRRHTVAYRGLVWKLEQQKRGAPHFHLVIFWLRRPADDELRPWVAKNWHEVSEPSSEHQQKVGTRVDNVRTDGRNGRRRLMNYLAKYVAKSGQWIDHETGETVETGRCWGVCGDVPVLDLGAVTFETRDSYCQFIRRQRRHGRGSRYLAQLTVRRAGFLVFGEGRDLVQLFRGLAVVELRPPREPSG